MGLVDPAQDLRHVFPPLAALEGQGLQGCAHTSQELFAIIKRPDLIAGGERGAITVKNLQGIAYQLCVEVVHG
jgi:hypothetical protein